MVGLKANGDKIIMSKTTDKLDTFKVDINLGMPQRVADYLNWAAVIAPGRAISYPQIAKVCMMRNRLPAENETCVEQIKHAAGRAKKSLMDRYRRGIVTHPGYGIRATTGTEDTARTQYANDGKRIASAIKHADRTRSIMNPNEIQDKDLRASVRRMDGVVKLLVSPEVMDKLLPEKAEEE